MKIAPARDSSRPVPNAGRRRQSLSTSTSTSSILFSFPSNISISYEEGTDATWVRELFEGDILNLIGNHRYRRFSQNGIMFYKRMSAIRKEAAKTCEFVFLDAPHILIPADLPSSLSLSSLDSDSAPNEAANQDPELTPRSWWRANDDKTIYYGVDETLVYLKDFLGKQQTPFDIVFGFSQGAAMAALLTAILENPHAYKPVSFLNTTTQEPIHPPFKSAIYGCGFAPVADHLSALFSSPLGKYTKTLHVIGRTDPIVDMKRAMSLVDVCVPENRRVEMHDGGHFIPSKVTWRSFFAKYLASDDPFSVPSPTPELAIPTIPAEPAEINGFLNRL